MKFIFYTIGKFFIKLSKRELEMENDLFQIVIGVLESTRDGEVDKKEISSLRKKAYDVLLNYGFSKKQ